MATLSSLFKGGVKKKISAAVKKAAKERKDQKERTETLRQWAKQSAQTQGIGMKMPKGLGFKKSGGKITYKMTGGQVVSSGYD